MARGAERAMGGTSTVQRGTSNTELDWFEQKAANEGELGTSGGAQNIFPLNSFELAWFALNWTGINLS